MSCQFLLQSLCIYKFFCCIFDSLTDFFSFAIIQLSFFLIMAHCYPIDKVLKREKTFHRDMHFGFFFFFGNVKHVLKLSSSFNCSFGWTTQSSEPSWWHTIPFIKFRGLIFSPSTCSAGLGSDFIWLNCVYRCVAQPSTWFYRMPHLPSFTYSPLIPAEDEVLCGPGSICSDGFLPHSGDLLSFFGLLRF